jgi:exodeoxyribonuclease VII large subunit
MFDYETSEPAIWTVSNLTNYLRDLLDIDYRLQDISVAGEIFNFTRARSGHLYFTLRDENAQLKCVLWRSNAGRLTFRPGDGDAVEARGRVSIYEAGGIYQLYVERLEPAGRGDLAQAFERLKMKLANEGLFDVEFKKPIPPIPTKIGIVTSADAAALKDILNVLGRRWSMISVLVAPSLVQGNEAPAQLVQSIRWLDTRNDIDTIIIARGGGPMEDLWAFNDEQVARSIFEAKHPIIVGVGHETDFTIADFVADQRAPTPSAAAELAVPDSIDIRKSLRSFRAILTDRMANVVAQHSTSLELLEKTLVHLSPHLMVNNNLQRVDWLSSRLDQANFNSLQNRKNRFSVALTALDSVSPLATLARGYAIVQGQDGYIIHSVDDVAAGDRLTIRVSDGDFGAKAE